MKYQIQNYDAVSRLPRIKTLRRQLQALNFLAILTRNQDVKSIVRASKAELDAIVYTIDRFYELLGDRNWIFCDSFNLDVMKEVINTNSADEAEARLISYFTEPEHLSFMVSRLNRFPDMRPRIPLLRRAEADYLEGRYYSSVLVVISVMDGFVNDAFKEERRGLHTRMPEELHLKDRVSTIWQGLPNVQKTFTRPVHKRTDDPLYDVCRHAIIHGMATNYDNPIIATKTWCLLFAVGDWAEALITREKKAHEDHARDEKQHSLPDMLIHASQIEENRRRLDKWSKHQINLESPDSYDKDCLDSCISFFNSWQQENYGKLAAFFPSYTNKAQGKLAGEARLLYSVHKITGYEIKSLERTAAAVAIATVAVTGPDRSWTCSIRFVRQMDNQPVADWEPGSWKVMLYASAPFVDIEQ